MGEVSDTINAFDKEMREARDKIMAIVEKYGIKDPQNKIGISFQESKEEGKISLWLVYSPDLWDGCF